jgi:hypothetical protein
MAIDNKQPVHPSRGRLRISVEVLQPRQREVIVDPASRRDSDNPVARQIVKPGGDEDLAREDKKGWDYAPCRSDALY